MQVTIRDSKTGKEKTMPERFAKVLTRIGKASYITRDMEATVVAPTAVFVAPVFVEKAEEKEEEQNELAEKPVENAVISEEIRQKRVYTRREKA